MLYHEATFKMEHQERAIETLHSTTHDAATIASRAQVGQLLIGHFSARYEALDELLTEAHSIFPATQLALEGHTFTIDRQ